MMNLTRNIVFLIVCVFCFGRTQQAQTTAFTYPGELTGGSLAAGTVFAQDEEYNVMKGTETPVFHKPSDTGKCYVFSEYIVKTEQSEDGGENIAVYKRGTSTSAKSACQTKGDEYQSIKDSDNNNFYGLSGSLIFIDSGTSVESRGLEIYNLTSGKTITNLEYRDEATLVEGRFVVDDSPSVKKGLLKTCKEAAKWKRDGGGGVGWVQGKKLDLQTLKEISVSALRCVYMQ